MLLLVALALLHGLALDTRQAVQDILWHFVQRDPVLADTLLKQTLAEDQTAFHAEFAGQLCVLRDANQPGRMALLQKFVFSALRQQTAEKPLSSLLTPFLTALTHAIRHAPDGTPLALAADELLLLYKCAFHALEGTLLKDAALRLLCALVHANPKLYKELLSAAHISADSLDAVLAAKPCPLGVLGVLACASAEAGRILLESGVLQRMKTRLSESKADSSLERMLQFLARVAHEPRVLKPWMGEQLFDTLFHVIATNHIGIFVLMHT